MIRREEYWMCRSLLRHESRITSLKWLSLAVCKQASESGSSWSVKLQNQGCLQGVLENWPGETTDIKIKSREQGAGR